MSREGASPAIAGTVTGLSVSHRTASLDQIEQASHPDASALMTSMLEHPDVSECFVIETCNRVERYVVTESPARGRELLGDTIPEGARSAAAWFDHEEAIEHLVRVGAGLESMVIGEDEILGQLRRACATADEVGGLGYLLEDTVWKAIHCGERVRTETTINEGIVSLAQAAVEAAETHMAVEEANVLVVGAGTMGQRAGTALIDCAPETICIANRTLERATELATTLPIDTVVTGLEELTQRIVWADLVIATLDIREPIISPHQLSDAGRTLVVDLGRPRNVLGADRFDHITYIDLEDIEAVTRRTRADRAEAAAAASSIVEAECAHLHERFKRKQADDVISAMYAGAERIKRRELETARNKFESQETLSAEEEAILEGLADALVGQLLAAPTKSLRDAAGEDDWETIQTALRLFDPSLPSGEIEGDEATSAGERITERS